MERMRGALSQSLIVLVLLVFQCPVEPLCVDEFPIPRSQHLLSLRHLCNSTAEAGQTCGAVSTLTDGSDACAYVRANCSEGVPPPSVSLAASRITYTCSQQFIVLGTCSSCNSTPARRADSVVPYIRLFYCYARRTGLPVAICFQARAPYGLLAPVSVCYLQACAIWLHLAIWFLQCCAPALAWGACGALCLLR